MTNDSEPGDPPADGRPASEWVQADISRAIDYRKEFYRYAIGVATALLAFTISFPPALTEIYEPWLIKAGWYALAMAVVAGVAIHYVWARFFISFRDYDNRDKRDEGKRVRRRLTRLRRGLELMLLVALIAGVLLIAAFASFNLGNIAPKGASAATATAP